MSTNMEELLRESLQRQADRAVHPERVLSGLPTRAARHSRQRHRGTVVAVASALAVATAVSVPILATDRAPAGTAAASGSGSGLAIVPGGPAPAAPTAVRVPVRYDLTWLPPTMRERSRAFTPASADFGATTIRAWNNRSIGSSGDFGGTRVELYVMPASVDSNNGVPVDVNGKRGYYISSDDKSYIQWRATPDVVLHVSEHETGMSKVDLLKVARSVRPSQDTLVVPLEFGWLPSGLTSGYAGASGDSAASWRLDLSAVQLTDPTAGNDPKKQKSQGLLDVGAVLSTTTNAPAGGEAVTVNGRPGRYVTKEHPHLRVTQHFVVVELGDGRVLTVSGDGPWSRPDFLRVADGVWVGPQPNLSWLGTR